VVSRQVRGKWRKLKSTAGGAYFDDVGGVAAWRQLEQARRAGGR
jgi:hypothetical protein